MLIELKNIQKTYSTKVGVTFRALNNISTTFDNSGLVFLVGQSGSGKSTLLNVIGGLDSFDSGTLTVAGRSMRNLSQKEVDSFRNTLIGFVFQEFNLLDTLSVAENVRLALEMQDGGKDADKKVADALEQMGIADKANHKTTDLSGGQRQRVAIARALVKDPRIILADEPTGALDSAMGDEIFGILKKMSADRLVIIVTHDLEKATQYGDRIIEMKDGRIYRDVRRRAEGEPPAPECVQILSDTLVRIDPGQNIGATDLERINNIISDSGRKTFLSFETDGRKVKAMFPNLRDAVDGTEIKADGVSKTATVTDNTAQSGDEIAAVKEKFVPYKSKNEPTPQFEYKKSRLPASKTLRLGLNNLKYKKGRLILTIIMSIFAFALFGVAQSFTGYNVQNAIAKTVSEERYQSVAVINGSDSADRMKRIRQSDIDMLTERNPQVKLYKQYNLNLSTSFGINFNGVVEVDDVTKLGHAMYAGASSIPDYNSVIISQIIANELVSSGNLHVSTVEGVVGQRINASGRNYVIVGIFACDMYKYEGMENYEKIQAQRIDDSTGNRQLFVKPGFIEHYALNSNTETSKFSALLDIGVENEQLDITVFVATDEIMSKVNIDLSSCPNGSMQITSENEIFLVNDDIFLQNLGITKGISNDNTRTIEQINSYDGRRLTINYNDLPVYASNTFEIVGLMANANTLGGPSVFNNSIMVHKNAYVVMFNNIIYPSQLIAQMPNNAAATRNFVNSSYDLGLKINSTYVNDYNEVLAFLSVLRNVLLGLSFGVSILVVVLLYSFISSSIRSTKKQIGILRALGAKQSDTFKIYAGEGFIVTVFALIISSILLAVFAPLLNVLFSRTYGYYFSLIAIEWWVYAIMAGLTFVVTLVAVLLPLRKFNKITPIDAISHRDN